MPLFGRSVLIVEDECLLAFDLKNTIQKSRGEVIGPAYSLRSGLSLADDPKLSLAILDYQLGPETSLPIAVKLQGLQVPFVFYTASADSQLSEVWAQIPVIEKPASPAMIISTLVKASHNSCYH